CFISHPVASFVPDDVPKDKLVYMPATTDAIDGLNKSLTQRNIHYYWRVFNRISFDQTGKRCAFWSRPYVVQIARFDPSKGIPDLIRAYDIFRKKVDGVLPLSRIPQLVIAGHGSVDDPDGVVVFEEVLSMLEEEEFNTIAHDVICVRVPPSDQMLNALLRGAIVAFQLSIREGFEIKVTEALAKGVPVIAYASGGIPHQVRHGRTGFLIKSGNVDEVAERLRQLVMDLEPEKRTAVDHVQDPSVREWGATGAPIPGENMKIMSEPTMSVRNRLSEAAKKCLGEEFFTVFQTVNWLYLWLALQDGTFEEKLASTIERVKNPTTDLPPPRQEHIVEEIGGSIDDVTNGLTTLDVHIEDRTWDSASNTSNPRASGTDGSTHESGESRFEAVNGGGQQMQNILTNVTGSPKTMALADSCISSMIPAGHGDSASDVLVRSYESEVYQRMQEAAEGEVEVEEHIDEGIDKEARAFEQQRHEMAGNTVWVKEMWQNDPEYLWWQQATTKSCGAGRV
ncbi:hypothetical protein HK102_010757, partial [Quaeritorhiza haematococci]